MRCDEFKKYLSVSDRAALDTHAHPQGTTKPESHSRKVVIAAKAETCTPGMIGDFQIKEFDGVALAHLAECAACRALLAADERLENVIRRELKKVAVPERLMARIDQNLRGMEETVGKNTSLFQWKMVVPALAMAMLALILLFPFTGNINNPEKLARLAVDSHMKNYAMIFEATEVSDIPGWFIGKLDFNIKIPDLAGKGLSLVGGRKCSIGNKAAAYLFYNKNGKRASLFMIDADDIRFKMEHNRIYELSEQQKNVLLWKDEALVYVLVKSQT